MAIVNGAELRFLSAAAVKSEGAACVEAAAGRGVKRARDIAAEEDA
jgi:hypothetical protein